MTPGLFYGVNIPNVETTGFTFTCYFFHRFLLTVSIYATLISTLLLKGHFLGFLKRRQSTASGVFAIAFTNQQYATLVAPSRLSHAPSRLSSKMSGHESITYINTGNSLGFTNIETGVTTIYLLMHVKM